MGIHLGPCLNTGSQWIFVKVNRVQVIKKNKQIIYPPTVAGFYQPARYSHL